MSTVTVALEINAGVVLVTSRTKDDEKYYLFSAPTTSRVRNRNRKVYESIVVGTGH